MKEPLIGPAGVATPINSPEGKFPACVSQWLLVCPGQSPAWDSYMLGVIHLRGLILGRPAHKRFAAATHEILLAALDPERGPRDDAPETLVMLQPVNLVHQVALPDDAAAAELVRLAAQAVVNGHLWAEPPLSGQTEPWVSTLDGTAAHLRGEHG